MIRPRWILAGAALLLATTAIGETAAQEAPTTSEVRSLAVVLAGRLNLRTAPSLEASVARTVERGDTLCVIGASDDWLRVLVTPPDEGASSQVYAARGFVSLVRAGPDDVRRAGCR